MEVEILNVKISSLGFGTGRGSGHNVRYSRREDFFKSKITASEKSKIIMSPK